MLKLVSLAILTLQLVNCLPSNGASGQTSTFVKPDFCRSSDCPEFTVLENFAGIYQKRRYEASRWISSRSQGMNFRAAKLFMYRKLSKYIRGNNSEGRKIAMTVPVITRVLNNQDSDRDYTMSFYVHGSNPPTPSDPTVTIDDLEEQTFYVKSFGGFARAIDRWVDEANTLASLLDDEKYNSTYYYTAAYNGPFTLRNRHNEIWLPAFE